MKPIEPTSEPGVTAESLLADVRRLAGRACPDCATPVSAEDVLMGLALGFRGRPFCFPCLAKRLDRSVEELRTWLSGYFRQRECFQEAWTSLTQPSPGGAPTSRVGSGG